MEDDSKGLKNRPPFETSQRVATLSPILDSYKGPQYKHNPAFAGEVPADNLGLVTGGEISDEEFRSWPEKRSKRGKE